MLSCIGNSEPKGANVDRLLWLDMEMTGTNPSYDLILEVALSITDMDLNPVGVDYEAVVYQPQEAVDKRMGAFVRDMHTDNGLLAQVPHGKSLKRVLEDLDWIFSRHNVYAQYDNPDWDKVTLAGASVHFDRAFLRQADPVMEQKLFHRHFDVSTLRTAVDGWNAVEQDWTSNGDEHRAMADVRTSIAQARQARRHISGRR